MAERPRVSLVVPFLGPPDELTSLVSRLERLELVPGDEAIVADNGLAGTAVASDRIVIRPAAGRRSPGFARNRGAAGARGEWLVFLDADTDPVPDLLARYLDPPPRAGTAVLAGGIRDALAPGSTRPGLAARRAVTAGHLDHRVTVGRGRFAYAQSANCAIRRSAFLAAGGFDEAARAGEDADLCLRLAGMGWELEVRPQALAAHRPRDTVRASMRQLAVHGAGAAWCNRQHPGSFPPPSPLGFAARLARSGAGALAAIARGDREAAARASLELGQAAAFEFGRLLPNRSRA